MDDEQQSGRTCGVGSCAFQKVTHLTAGGVVVDTGKRHRAAAGLIQAVLILALSRRSAHKAVMKSGADRLGRLAERRSDRSTSRASAEGYVGSITFPGSLSAGSGCCLTGTVSRWSRWEQIGVSEHGFKRDCSDDQAQFVTSSASVALGTAQLRPGQRGPPVDICLSLPAAAPWLECGAPIQWPGLPGSRCLRQDRGITTVTANVRDRGRPLTCGVT